MKLFQKKPLYIVLLVVFTLILIADLVLRFAVGGRPNRPEGFSASGGWSASEDFDPNNLPEGFDASSIPNMPGGGSFDPNNLPEDFDASSMPNMPGGGSFDPNNLPEDFDASSMPNRPDSGDFDPENMPEGFNPQQGGFGNMPGGSGFRQRGGFLSTVRKLWIPILIVCVLVDALSIFMLARIARKTKREEGQADSEAKEDDPGPKRKNKKLWILLLIPVLLAGILLKLLTPAATRDTSSVTVQEKVVQAEAASEQISKVFLSGGTLTAEDAVTVSLPGDIRIESFAVSNGDSVEAGDLIATVEKSSVISSIRSIQEVMTELDGELSETADDNDDEITAPSGGKVKVLYAEAGTPVADTMAQYGALMVLSLDGMMSAQIPADDSLNVGDRVTVRLSDGTEEAGRVETVRDGTATVTLSDENAVYGDSVTVLDAGGKTLGTASLTIHSALKITGYRGITEEISVEAGDTVTSGKTLLTLKNAEQSPAYTNLLQQRRNLSEQMKHLFELYQTGEVLADQAGEITGINEDLVKLSAADGDYKIILLSNNPLGESEEGVVNFAAQVVSNDGGTLNVRANTQPLGEIDFTGVGGMNTAQFTADTSKAVPGSVSVFTWNGSGWSAGSASDIQPGDIVVFSYDTDGNLLWIVRAAGTLPDTPDKPDNPDQPDNPDNPDQPDKPDNPDQPENPNQPDNPGQQDNSNFPDNPNQQTDPGGSSQQTFPNGGNMPSDQGSSFGGNGFSGFSGSGSAQMPSGMTGSYDAGGQAAGGSGTASEPTYTVDESAIYRLTPRNTMTVEISVDELDINSLRIGQQAEVTLDALPGQSFEGQIVSLDADGSYEEGNTKYKVTVSVPRSEQMLSGMNAGIKVSLGDAKECLGIPEAALIEKSGKTYVYTLYDESKDLLGGLIQVETGLSDGTNVQIVSGLEAGQSVFYRYADSIEYSFVRRV